MLTNTQMNTALASAGYLSCRVFTAEDLSVELWQGKRGLIAKLVWTAADNGRILTNVGVPLDDLQTLVSWLN